MKNGLLMILFVFTCFGCNKETNLSNPQIITTDIDNFWKAYDVMVTTQDSILQYKYLDSLFFQKGTLGLQGIMQARNYTPQDYILAINRYPKFWESIRENTLKTERYTDDLNNGIEKIRGIYPELKPAKMYFTIGALQSGGTYLDSLVLIGSEIAMADKHTVSSEFPEDTRAGRRTYFDSNPINDLVLLNIHEYVHTQQNDLEHNLLSYCLHEGIAEFVSTTALGVPSVVPAINYGKSNGAVKMKFEEELFYGNNVYHWLWSDFLNEFNQRDLGYYIGYSLAEINYINALDKQVAIKEMIELDYTNKTQIEEFVNRTKFFSKSLEDLYTHFDTSRPSIINISEFQNLSTSVNPNITEITIEFSEPLNGQNTGVDYGELGPEYFPKIVDRFWSADNQSWIIKVDLEPNKHYQFLISRNFRNQKGVPLKEYVIDFTTTK